MPPAKRARLSISLLDPMTASPPPPPLRERLPHIVAWPEDMSAEEEANVADAYFDLFVRRPNHFVYASIIKSSASDPHTALMALKDEGAFASVKARRALVEVVYEAKKAPAAHRLDCSQDLLDTLERYATCAFSLEPDRVSVGCGVIPEKRMMSQRLGGG
jgi:hypothetical protein